MQKKSIHGKPAPERRCAGCGERFPKQSLVRVVRSPEGLVSLDLTGKAAGRGTYICRSAACLRRARRARRLETNLDCVVPPEIYDILEGELEVNAGKEQ